MGSAGGTGVPNIPGVGGSGMSNSISGSSVTYSKGGNARSGIPGEANSGNGGAGCSYGIATCPGGSGIVILRYADSYAVAASASGSTYTQTGGYHIYTFTGSGSITF